MFCLTTLLIFVNFVALKIEFFVALKIEFTLKWTGPDIAKVNFPVIQVQCVMGDYNSPE